MITQTVEPHAAPVTNVFSHRALMVIARYWPAIGGAEMHSREMVKHLHQQGVDTKVLCHCSDQPMSNELAALQAPESVVMDDNIPVYQRPYNGLGKTVMSKLASAYASRRLCRPFFNLPMKAFSENAIVQAGQDVQVIHNVYCGMTMVSEAAMSAAQRLGVPFVFTPLARTCDGPKSAWLTPRLQRLYQGADAIITLTEHEKQWIANMNIDPDKIHVCPMAPILPEAAPDSLIREHLAIGDKPIVLFLGRHDESKGYRALADSCEQVWQHRPDTQFVFFGPQSASSKTYLTNKQDARIHLVETSCQQLKMSALSACDLLCVPSDKESLGVVYLEAWQMKKPVIAGDIAVLREVVDHGKNGFVCHQNPDQLASYLLRLLNNQPLRRVMGELGHKKVEASFTWPGMANQIRHIYQSLLQTNCH